MNTYVLSYQRSLLRSEFFITPFREIRGVRYCPCFRRLGVLRASGLEEVSHRAAVGPPRRLGDRLVDEGGRAPRVKPPLGDFPAP